MDESFDDNFHQKKNVLALRLQQRRPREVLADQGIMPPLKSPGTYFSERQKLEHARNKDYLNHALPSRPDREVLVQKHILEDTSAAGLLVSSQKDLKKAKLVDDLNDKIAFRPGVIELVERNIIPANENLQEAIKGGRIQYKKISDLVDDDSGDALSPEQLSSLTTNSNFLSLSSASVTSPNTVSSAVYSTKHENTLIQSASGSSFYTQNTSHPYLSRQTSKNSKISQSSFGSKMVSVRKKKEKPKFKKLKYHQYIPPDQLGKLGDKTTSSTDSDTPYSRLLHQQQVYLQMQIRNNQYGSSITGQRTTDNAGNLAFNQNVAPPTPPAFPFTQTMKVHKLRNPNSPLTLSRLDEMKVSELKDELKQRGQKVTGTKEVLAERLKPYCVSSEIMADDKNSNFSLSSPSMITENVGSSSPGLSGNQNLFSGGTALSLRVARMPVPERHKIVLKREPLTMPTWNHTGESMGTQTSFSPSHPSSGGPSSLDDKDKIMEQQRQEINALKQSLEQTKAQLEQRHLMPQNMQNNSVQIMTQSQDHTQMAAVSFQFSPVTQQPSIMQNAGLPSNSNMSMHNQQQSVNLPNYSQSFELLNGPTSSQAIVPNTTGADMDDFLNFITEPTDMQPSPVARVLLNDHEAYRGLNDPSSTINPNNTAYTQQTDYGGHKAVRLRRARRQQSGPQLSQDFTIGSSDYQKNQGPDVGKMLVDSAGDALMDTTFPPVVHRYSYPNLDHHSSDHSKLNSRNSVDSCLLYSTPHFSPMDTASIDTSSQQDILNDLRLSTSSLDSNEQMLSTVNMSPVTPSRLNQQSHFIPHSSNSPRYSNQNLIKSASQELLSNPQPINKPNNSELGWLDLTLGSAVAGPPSPGGLLDFNSISHCMHQSQHSNPVSNRGSQDADLNLSFGDPNSLHYQGIVNNVDFNFDSLDGLFGSNLNT